MSIHLSHRSFIQEWNAIITHSLHVDIMDNILVVKYFHFTLYIIINIKSRGKVTKW